jgi:hypothetical protein
MLCFSLMARSRSREKRSVSTDDAPDDRFRIFPLLPLFFFLVTFIKRATTSIESCFYRFNNSTTKTEMMGTARVSSLQATSDDTQCARTGAGKKPVLHRTSTSKISLVDMLVYGDIKPIELVHDRSRNPSAHLNPPRENETCFEMPWSRGNSDPIVGDQPCIPPIQIQRTGGQTKTGIGQIFCPFDGPYDNRLPIEPYAPHQYNTYGTSSHRRRFIPSAEPVEMPRAATLLPSSSSERTVQALQDASDASQDSSQLGQPTKQNTTNNMNSTQLHNFPPNQGYQEQQQSMWVDNKSRPRSKAIAIKRNNNRCPEECSASLSEASSERHYDWATWRMYNRIVDHRRNQRHTTMSSSLPPLAMDHHHANQGLTHPDDRMHADRFQSRGAADYIHDGEVFELDF